jgi:PEP-CTERM motif-containing protein
VRRAAGIAPALSVLVLAAAARAISIVDPGQGPVALLALRLVGVPEPSTALLFGTALALLSMRRA